MCVIIYFQLLGYSYGEVLRHEFDQMLVRVDQLEEIFNLMLVKVDQLEEETLTKNLNGGMSEYII